MMNVELAIFGIIVAFGMFVATIFPSLVAPVISVLNGGL